MAGQSERELNPYWKDGGSGLPSSSEVVVSATPLGGVGDGGLAWLKKSFQRAKQQAKDEGKSLEDVVSERWGSIEHFYSLLEDAERKAEETSGSSSSRSLFRRPARDSDSDDERRRSRHHRRGRHDDRNEQDDRRHHRRDYLERPRDADRDQRRRDGDKQQRSWRKYDKVTKSEDLPRPERIEDEGRRRGTPPIVPHKPITTEQSPMELEEEEEPEVVPEEDKPCILTDKEMNELNAKLFKAELLGDSDLINSLKSKLEEAKNARDEYIKSGKNPQAEATTKVVTKIILGGGSRGGKRSRDKPTESHKEGQRVRYFPDDEKRTLKSMFEKEKMTTAEDENALFSRLMGKHTKATEEYDVDDIYVDKASSSRQAEKDQKREVENVLYEEKAIAKVLDNCVWCFDGKLLQKNLIIAIGQTCYLCVPPHQSLTDGHCLIVPMSHVSASTDLDEDVFSEMQKFKKALVRMFFQEEEDVVFFETASYLKRRPHMYVECVPMPKETGELAPIYFKKALQECEKEWAQNKKVVDLKKGDIRRTVPKSLPYFNVEFGDDGTGFAHVIEVERDFPSNFAQEIVGGMLELDHHIWRKQKKDDFNKQRAKVMSFMKMWGPFDFTRPLTEVSSSEAT